MHTLATIDLVQAIPTPEEVRARLAHLARQRRLLRGLLRLAEQCRQSLPPPTEPTVNRQGLPRKGGPTDAV
jgi:hypothetical protein